MNITAIQPIIQETTLVALIEAANELCLAVETLKMAQPSTLDNYIGRMVLQRNVELNAILKAILV